MTGNMFGELREVDEYGWKWQGKLAMDLGGDMRDIELLVQGMNQSEITSKQKEALRIFIEKWPASQDHLIDTLIQYYNEKVRFSYGPEDTEEAEAWWPEIRTKEALLQAVTLESIVVAEDFMMDDGRHIYLLFSKTWGGEDLDDNGIGVCFIDEEIDEISYKEIAF